MTNRNFGGEGNSAQASYPIPTPFRKSRFETLNSSAQFATPATAILTTKSGTNEFHGSFFETLRNNYFGIAKARQNPANFAAPHLVRNEFGGSVGGPIVIPKLYNGKNKSFFFFAYERFSLRQAANQLVFVPTAAMRNGDFSGLMNSAGMLQHLYDPNTTDANYAAPAVPEQPDPDQPHQSSGQDALCGDSPSEHASTIRWSTPISTTLTTSADGPEHHVPPGPCVQRKQPRLLPVHRHRQSAKLCATIRISSPANIEGGGLPAGATGFQQIPIQTISGPWVSRTSFRPTFFSETIFSRQWMRQYVEGTGDVDQNYEKQLGLPNNFGQTGFPAIGANLIMPYGGSQWNYGMNQRISTLDENLNKIWGRHQFPFGGRYRHEHFGYLSDRQPDTIAFTQSRNRHLRSGDRHQLRRPGQYRLCGCRLLPRRGQFLQPGEECPLRTISPAGVRFLFSGQLPREQIALRSTRDFAGRCIPRRTRRTT